MISKIRYPNGRTYLCDDCNKAAEKFITLARAQAAGWAISRNRKNCYCPECAPKHRHTGCKGATGSKSLPSQPGPKGYIQEKIEII